MAEVYVVQKFGGGLELSEDDRKKAVEMGCIEKAARAIPENAILVAHSTIGWIGVYVNFKRIKRFKNVCRAVSFAKSIAA